MVVLLKHVGTTDCCRDVLNTQKVCEYIRKLICTRLEYSAREAVWAWGLVRVYLFKGFCTPLFSMCPVDRGPGPLASPRQGCYAQSAHKNNSAHLEGVGAMVVCLHLGSVLPLCIIYCFPECIPAFPVFVRIPRFASVVALLKP